MATARLATEIRPPAEMREFGTHMGRISRQSLVFFAGTIFTAAAGYLFKIYLARALGAEALGIYALGITITGLLGIFNGLGLPQAAVRFVAAYSATGRFDLLRGFLAWSGALMLVCNVFVGGMVLLVGPWLAVHFYHTPALKAYLGLFVAILFLGALNLFLGQILGGYKDVTHRTAITNFIGIPVTMLVAWAAISQGFGLRGYIAAQVIGAMVVLFLLGASVWRLTPAATRSFVTRMPRLEKQVVSFSSAALGVGFLEFAMGQTDKVLIGYYLNARALGIYTVAAALVAFVPIALQSANQIFSPTIADLHARGQTELLGRIFQTLTRWILACTIPLATAMIVFAPALMRIFGRDFRTGWPILVIGTLGQLVNCGVGSVGYLLLMSGHQTRLIQAQAVSAVIMVLLSLALIPAWGISGAALASAVTNVMTNILCLREVRRSVGLSPFTKGYFRLLLPTCSAAIALLLWRDALGKVRPEWVVVAAGFLLAYLIFAVVTWAHGLDSDDEFIATAAWARVRGFLSRAEANA